MGRVIGLVVLVAVLVFPQGLRADTLPDVVWLRLLKPLQGAFSRELPAPVQVGFRAEGNLREVSVSWRLLRGDTALARGDTLVATALRGTETVFRLTLPGMVGGSYALELTADPENRIEEKDERNNRIVLSFSVPNGAPVRFRCEGPEGSSWQISRLELNTATGSPYPDENGTRSDTTRSDGQEIVVNGIEPGSYMGVFFGPTVNRIPILVSSGAFEMPGPPGEIKVVWSRTTPYITGRPKIQGETSETGLGGQSAAPRWQPNSRFTLDGSVRNPTDRSADIQWLLRFAAKDGTESMVKDTLLTLGALATERLALTGRVPRNPGSYLIQAEVHVPWPSGFEDLGEADRVASHVLPLGWIEIQR